MLSKLARLRRRRDDELEEFRSLLEPPSTFEDGFSWSAFFGALFVALLMVPGSIYMVLIAGQAVGPAAQWVTLILFIEVARRANKTLRRAEIFTLFYLAGAIMVTASMAHGLFDGGLRLLWHQFFVRSDAALAAGFADDIPHWVAPNDPDVLDRRSLLMWEWLPAIGLVAFTFVIGRIDNMILGYGLFRLTSDIEKLPFPLAPVGAQGVLALSEEQEEESGGRVSDDPGQDKSAEPGGSWRWRVFSIGAVIGLAFGAVYIGIPTVSAALLGTPIEILPIPFVDFTADTAPLLPAAATGVSLNLGQVIFGMVFPFWAVMGTFAGLIITFVLNPVLYDPSILGLDAAGMRPVLTSWQPGDDMVTTFWKNQVDFYFSFSIGVALAIAAVGFWSVFKAVGRQRKRRRETAGLDRDAFSPPEGRGDIRPWVIAATYFIVTGLYIGVSMYLLYITDGSIYWPVVWVMMFYAFVYTPTISYVTARLEGIAGEVLNIPFVREATLILSGYQGVAVWFLPIPLHNYGQMVVQYRQAELTGTKFWSIWKAEILLTPIILVGTLLFAHFIWGMGDVPGAAYPFAQELWPLTAEHQALVFSSTQGGFSAFEEAINVEYIGWGLGAGLLLFVGLGWLGAPTFFMYGVVKGLNQTLPFMIIPQVIGAVIGRYYFQRKLGLKWRQYIPVVAAGFACGMGLVGTLGVGFTFMAKSVLPLPF